MSNPPVESRFEKGVSGNRAGRPRGSKSKATMAREAADFEITIEVAGRKRRVCLIGAVLSNLSKRASESVSFAKIREKADAHLSPGAEESQLGVLIYWRLDPETWRDDLKRQQDELQRRAAELEGSLLGGYEAKEPT